MSSLLKVEHPHVELTRLGAVVKGSRVVVRRLWSWHSRGVTCEVLWNRYPFLPRGAILDALSFAYDNPALIEEELAKEERELQQLPLVPGAQQTELPLKR